MPPSIRLRKDKRQSMFLFMSHCDKVCVSTRRLDFCFVLGFFFRNRTETFANRRKAGLIFIWFFYLFVQAWNVSLVGQSIFSQPNKTDAFPLTHLVGFNICTIMSHDCRYMAGWERHQSRQTILHTCKGGFFLSLFSSKWLCIIEIVKSFLFRTGQNRTAIN